MAGVHRIGAVGAGPVADRAEVIPEDAPSLRMRRRLRRTACQPVERGVAPTRPAQHQAELDLQCTPPGMLLREDFEGMQGLGALPAGFERLRLKQQDRRMGAHL